MVENSIALFTDDKDVFADLIVGFYIHANATERQGIEQMLLELALLGNLDWGYKLVEDLQRYAVKKGRYAA